jgi:hypothetical protein
MKSKRLTTVWIDNTSLKVEICDTWKTREHGLMERKKLSKNQGMLFVFDHPGFYAFWMKNTYIPLSIAFISIDGEIVQIDSMMPLDTLNLHIPKKANQVCNRGKSRLVP